MGFDFDYPNTRRIGYEFMDEGTAVFVPVCPKCGRYVKPDDTFLANHEGQPIAENATCKKCGRVHMPFEGYM